MKRLLAYLFIVLGLGLVVSVNANAKISKFAKYQEGYFCIWQPKYPENTTGGVAGTYMPFHLFQASANKIFQDCKEYADYIVYKENWKLFKILHFIYINKEHYDRNIVLPKKYLNRIKTEAVDLRVDNTQIAKKEPSQTQKNFDKEVFITKLNNFEQSIQRLTNRKEGFQFVKINADSSSDLAHCNKIKSEIISDIDKLNKEYNYYFKSIKIPDNLIKFSLKISELENYVDDLGTDLSCDDIKIAKTEPTQTHEVAKKLVTKKIDIIFCKYKYEEEITPLHKIYKNDYCLNVKKMGEIVDYDEYVATNSNSRFCIDINRWIIDMYYIGTGNKCNSISFEDILYSNENFYFYLDEQQLASNKPYVKPERPELGIQIAKAEPTIKPKKKIKVAETTQEEFKPETGDIDNDAPVIVIAEAITVDSQAYTLKGKVKDKSKLYLEANGRPLKVSNKGNFELDGFIVDPNEGEQIKLVAIDQWKNKSEKTIIIKVEFEQVVDSRIYEKPNPSKIIVRKDRNKIAIIIGIEKYRSLKNIDAPFANRDANAFRAYANRALGIPNQNIKVLIDDEATRAETLKALTLWLPQAARGKAKDIYIFFAGHGLASDDGKNLYILPQDGDAALLQYTAISRLEMFELINKVKPNSVTMFFDTCYSGQTRNERMLVAGLRPIRLLESEQDKPNNFTIFTASNYDQTSGSIKEAKHGIFSYYLMKGMEGKADLDSDKKITNGELIAYLKQNVTEEAFINNRQQEPMLSGDPDKILMSYR